MKLLLCLFVFISGSSFPAVGSIWFQSSIVDLVKSAEDVVEADLIYYQNDTAIFLTRSLFSKSTTIRDTLVVVMQDEIFVSDSEHRHEYIDIEDAQKLILFLHKDVYGKITSFLGSARILVDEKIYYPQVFVIPGPFAFVPDNTGISWNDLKNNILTCSDRLKTADAFFEKPSSKKHNLEIFQWIEDQKHELSRRDCHLNADCGWGRQVWLPFEKIMASGHWEDAWKACELYNEMFGHYIFGKGDYANDDARDFFYKIAFKDDLDPEGRLMAFHFLSGSIWYQHNLSSPSDRLPDIKRKKVIETISALQPYFNEYTFQQWIIGFFSSLLEASNEELNSIGKQRVLPFIISKYSQPGFEFVRSDMSNLLKRHLAPEKLAEITGNDDQILADIIQSWVDTSRMELDFGFRLELQKAKVHQLPTVRFIHLSNPGSGSVDIPFPPTFRLPVEPYDGNTRYIKVDVSGLEPGSWKYYAFGKAGLDNQHAWKTNEVLLEIR